jgi:hypothetical protein
VMTNGSRVEPRIDADKQQDQSGTDHVGNGASDRGL